MESNTAKNFVLQLGSLISLYLSLSFFLVLAFAVINLGFPDATDDVWFINQAESSVRFGVAMVIVFFPTYLITTRYVNQTRRKETAGSYLTLTKWLIYLSLLIGGGVLLGDLVAVISTYLEGEITERFIMKALAVLVVIGGAFYYYLLDARGHWLSREKASVSIGAFVTAIVVAVVIYGLYSIESPQVARERRIDMEQLQDLQDMQWRIEEAVQVNGEVPNTIEELYVTEVPSASEGRAAYEYKVTENGFELCAEFDQASQPEEYQRFALPLDKEGVILNANNWEHTAGEFCFERTVSVE